MVITFPVSIDSLATQAISVSRTLKAYYEGHRDDFKKDDAVQPFESVRDEVYGAVRLERQREIQAKLLEELRGRYDVVIHRSKLGGK